ncbi:hypothetical protein TNCT_239901 [Trichonephila clavata]|uniref:Uncharacterized protein n=1 Tax=Trichonephila clavata TaxID=2740835 RepID=A0A8X6GZS1_TRICU|nr:hypothetical protein TNCT_239901 [Trichonephila clavata]
MHEVFGLQIVKFGFEWQLIAIVKAVNITNFCAAASKVPNKDPYLSFCSSSSSLFDEDPVFLSFCPKLHIPLDDTLNL